MNMTIEPSRARYRTAVAMQRLGNALGVELNPQFEDCELLERLATQAERWRMLDQCVRDREETSDERSPEDIYESTE